MPLSILIRSGWMLGPEEGAPLVAGTKVGGGPPGGLFSAAFPVGNDRKPLGGIPGPPLGAKGGIPGGTIIPGGGIKGGPPIPGGNGGPGKPGGGPLNDC